MTQPKRFLDFYIQSSFHVSLCYAAFYIVVSLQANFTPTWLEIVAVGCSTLVGYNLSKYVHLIRCNFPFKKSILTLTIIGTIVGFVSILHLGFYAVVLFAFCGLLTLFYALPVMLGRSLRQTPLLKLVTIGLSWAVLAVLLPHVTTESGYFKHSSVLHVQSEVRLLAPVIDVVQYSLFIIALCIPFEIRDLKYDDVNLKTLPQLIGVAKSKYLGYVLIFVVIAFEVVYKNSMFILVTIAVMLITGWAIRKSEPSKSDYYTSIFVEAIPMIWLALLGVFVLFFQFLL